MSVSSCHQLAKFGAISAASKCSAVSAHHICVPVHGSAPTELGSRQRLVCQEVQHRAGRFPVCSLELLRGEAQAAVQLSQRQHQLVGHGVGVVVGVSAEQLRVARAALAQPARQVHELVELRAEVATREHEVDAAEGRAAQLHAVVSLVVEHLELLQRVLPQHVQRALLHTHTLTRLITAHSTNELAPRRTPRRCHGITHAVTHSLTQYTHAVSQSVSQHTHTHALPHSLTHRGHVPPAASLARSALARRVHVFVFVAHCECWMQIVSERVSE